MTRGTWGGVTLVACLVIVLFGISACASMQDSRPLRVVSEQTAKIVVHPESVGCDTRAKVLYVSQFGSEPLDPTRKDGKGKISKVSLSGQLLEDQVFPTAGDVLNKPKGIWIEGDRLWVTDIDVVWVFDLKSRRGRKVELPGSGTTTFANDPTVMGKAL